MVPTLPKGLLTSARVLICTLDTPLVTEACLRTLLTHNVGVALTIALVAPAACRHWTYPLADLVGADLYESEEPLAHDAGLTVAYSLSDEPLLLCLDNDVTFEADGLVAEMIQSVEPDVFAVGVEQSEPVGHAWLGEQYWLWGRKGYLTSPRLPIYCTLLQRSAALDRAVQTFGFYCGMRSSPAERGVYYDTGGLLTDVMRADFGLRLRHERVAGWRDIYVPNRGRMTHWQSMTWHEGRYNQYEQIFREICAAHPL